jgi:hypothetical protein
MEQETLEQAAERLTELAYQNDNFEKGRLKRIGYYDGIIDGAEWQAKTMYTKEEVLRIITYCKEYLSFGDEFNEKEWFEQFKNK